MPPPYGLYMCKTNQLMKDFFGVQNRSNHPQINHQKG